MDAKTAFIRLGNGYIDELERMDRIYDALHSCHISLDAPSPLLDVVEKVLNGIYPESVGDLLELYNRSEVEVRINDDVFMTAYSVKDLAKLYNL